MPISNTMVRPATTEQNLSALQQTIPVTFQYQVHFTRGLFDPQNALFANTIASPTSSEPAKAIAVIDNGLLEHHPQLLEQLSAYAIHYSQQLFWAAPPVVVQGGEEVKNNPVWVEQLHQAIDNVGICRHSYVIAIAEALSWIGRLWGSNRSQRHSFNPRFQRLSWLKMTLVSA